MISTSPTMRILVAIDPVDFRKGIDGLAAICRKPRHEEQVKAAPASWLPWNDQKQAARIVLERGSALD